jgi:hypothetical protein
MQEENEETPALNEEQLEEVAYLSYGEEISRIIKRWMKKI